MKKTLVVLILTFFIFTSAGLDVARSEKPESLGKPKDNPSVYKSQKPIGDESENGPGKSDIAHIKSKNNKLLVTFEDDEDSEATSEGDVKDEIELEDKKNGLKVRAHENASLVIRNKLAAQTHFPLKVNLETNELTVTTPKGEKTVTVLPDAAVFNMLAANVLDQLGGKGGFQWLADQITQTATPSADLALTSTTSATITDEPGVSEDELDVLGFEGDSPIKLVLDEDGNLVYEIDGVKIEKFLGIFKVNVHRLVIVSAETGQLIEVKHNLANKILDLLSMDT